MLAGGGDGWLVERGFVRDVATGQVALAAKLQIIARTRITIPNFFIDKTSLKSNNIEYKRIRNDHLITHRPGKLPGLDGRFNTAVYFR